MRFIRRLSYLVCGVILITSVSADNQASCQDRKNGFKICRKSNTLVSVEEINPYYGKRNKFYMSDESISSIAPNAFKNLNISEMEIAFAVKKLYLEPESFSGLSKVKSLKIFLGPIPLITNNFQRMESLSYLMLIIDGSKRISEPDPPLELPNLTHLRVFDSNLQHIDNYTFSHVSPTITHLILTGNNIVSIEPKTFFQLKNLQSLEMKENKLTSISKNTFDGLNRLHTLNLMLNDIREIEIGAFLGNNISVLSLSDNNLKNLKYGIFNGLKKLKKLSLDYNQISRIEMGAFAGLNLSILDLSNNELAIIEAGAFKGFAAEEVYLPINQMVNIEDGAFKSSRIKSLYVFNDTNIIIDKFAWGLPVSTSLIVDWNF